MHSLVLLLALCSSPHPAVAAQHPTPQNACDKKHVATQERADLEKKRMKYPKEWELEVPKGTKLDALRKQLDQEICILPEQDLEDRTPIPVWFRVYLRKQFPDLRTSGPYQYPRTARRILQRLLDHPDSVEPPKAGKSPK